MLRATMELQKLKALMELEISKKVSTKCHQFMTSSSVNFLRRQKRNIVRTYALVYPLVRLETTVYPISLMTKNRMTKLRMDVVAN